MQGTQKLFTITAIAASLLAVYAPQALAQEIRIGGKFDAGYQFKRIANVDNANGTSQGGITTETLGDGGASTSRITIGATENLAPGYQAYIDLDLRFGNISEGSGGGSGGLNSNDKKVMGLRTPYGTIVWGAYNITNLIEAEKPYMVSPKDMEIVKFGISNPRESDLTNRVTEVSTKLIPVGDSVGFLFKGDYSFGDNRKSGNVTSSTPSTPLSNSADAYSVGTEFVVGRTKALRDFTLNYVIVHRVPNDDVSNRNGFTSRQSHFTYRPWFDPNFKFSSSFNINSGWNPNITEANGGPAYREKNTNFVVSYNINNKIELGAEVSHNNDLGSNRNSGRGFMVGGAYFLSKSAYFYAALMKQNYARNETYAGGKYDGTKAGYVDTLSKTDQRYLRFGMVKEF